MQYKLMTPGPVPLPPWVLKEIAEPVLHHRTNEFEAILERVLTKLKNVFVTTQPCFVLTATGTGAMEAALVNTVKKGDSVLTIDSGKFGHRWHEMSETLGYKSINLSFPWGEPIDLDKVSETLKKNPEIKALLCTACETSTGAQLPIKELAQLVRNTDTLIIVDAVTALGAFSLPMDDWGLDVVISGSQKAMMGPTGLALISCSAKAWEHVKKNAPAQAYYWNLVEEKKANDKMQTRFSSAVSLIRCMDVVLAHIEQIGFHNQLKLHADRAIYFRNHVVKAGIDIFPKIPAPSLTCIRLPKDVDGQKVQATLQDQHRIIVMGGQDQLKGKVLRIGHMGAMSYEDLNETAHAIHQVLNV